MSSLTNFYVRSKQIQTASENKSVVRFEHGFHVYQSVKWAKQFRLSDTVAISCTYYSLRAFFVIL